MNIYYENPQFMQLPNELQNHICNYLPQRPILIELKKMLKFLELNEDDDGDYSVFDDDEDDNIYRTCYSCSYPWFGDDVMCNHCREGEDSYLAQFADV